MSVNRDNVSHGVTVVRVRDVLASAEFYGDKLGFEIDFKFGDPTYYIGITRGGVTIHLTQYEDLEEQDGIPIMYIFVRNVDELYREFVQNGVTRLTGPENQDYGMRDFDVWDIDGYRLAFGTGLELLDDETK